MLQKGWNLQVHAGGPINSQYPLPLEAASWGFPPSHRTMRGQGLTLLRTSYHFMGALPYP